MSIQNKILEEIKDYAVQKLNAAYGYCGVAENDEMVHINSDDGKGSDLVITIKIKKD